MRILHLLNHVRKTGNGIVNVAVDLACLQVKNQFEVAIASLGGEYESLLASYGVKHFALNQTRHPLTLIQAARTYQRLIQTFQPDIVHAHMMTGVILARTLKGQNSYGLVSTVHNEFQRSAVLMGLADRVIAVSNAVAQSMQQRGIPQRKLRVVRNGTLNSPRTKPLHDYEPMLLKRPAITTVAGMYQRKGICELIEAFKQIAPKFPNVNLYLVGDGPDRSMFEMQAHQSGFSDRIHFEKFQPEPQRYLLSTDIFVLASHKDPSPLVIPEAREAGCAIVASNVDGIPEGLSGGKAGILVPPANSLLLADQLANLLEQPDLLKTWKQNSSIDLNSFRVERVHDETLQIYNECKSHG
ncbi:MAG: glycosyltransferase family 4 protein [Leptolyngbyaceae cyanobacterium bins.302]|nr:glycosyltransferase family 4 protein [Leptolyngbyaceae cyanobacterium bins.302]